jgi:hypothetical protein
VLLVDAGGGPLLVPCGADDVGADEEGGSPGAWLRGGCGRDGVVAAADDDDDDVPGGLVEGKGPSTVLGLKTASYDLYRFSVLAQSSTEMP